MDPVGTSRAALGRRGRGSHGRGHPDHGRSNDDQTEELPTHGRSPWELEVVVAFGAPESNATGVAAPQLDQDRETSQVPERFAVQEQQLQTSLVAS